MKNCFVYLHVLGEITINRHNLVVYLKMRLVGRRTADHILHHDLPVNEVDPQSGVGVIKGFIEMAVGREMYLPVGVIQHDIETAQQVVAQQTAGERIRGYVVIVFIKIGRHLPELVRTHLQFPDQRQPHLQFTAQPFCLRDHRPAFGKKDTAVFGELFAEQQAKARAGIEIKIKTLPFSILYLEPLDGQVRERGMQQCSFFRVAERTRFVNLDAVAVEIDTYNITAEKTIADNTIHLLAIHAAQYLVIIDMKIQVFDGKTRYVQFLIEHKRHFAHTADACYAGIRRPYRDIEFRTGRRVERNAPAAGIEDEIQAVGHIAETGMNDHHTAAELPEGKAGDQPGLRLRQNFLGSGRKEQRDKVYREEELSHTGSRIYDVMDVLLQGITQASIMHINDLYHKALAFDFLTEDEGIFLFENAALTELMYVADSLRRKQVPHGKVTWQIDRNVNTTNVCIANCKFCNFYRIPGHEEAYITDIDTYKKKIEETIRYGGDQLLLQGGHHPDLGLDFYVTLFRQLKSLYPDIKLHTLGPPEVAHITKLEKSTHREVLMALKEAGMDSLPGAGAEIFNDRVRRLISKGKCGAQEWLDIMHEAHKLHITTSATMMFGHVETLRERFEHLVKIREVQSRKPEQAKGFLAFIPWTFQDVDTLLARIRGVHNLTSAEEYLRMIALSRIMLPNVLNIQASWLTVGKKVAQLCLHGGANDFGSIMIEENVVSAAGAPHRFTSRSIQDAIREAGFEPQLRNQQYEWREMPAAIVEQVIDY